MSPVPEEVQDSGAQHSPKVGEEIRWQHGCILKQGILSRVIPSGYVVEKRWKRGMHMYFVAFRQVIEKPRA